MKYFFSACITVTTVRKNGHYPSTRVASFLSKRFAYVMGFEENSLQQHHIAAMLRGDDLGHKFCQTRLTPSEFQALYEFGCWWAREGVREGACDPASSEINLTPDEKSFVFLNLNTGRFLNVLSR